MRNLLRICTLCCLGCIFAIGQIDISPDLGKIPPDFGKPDNYTKALFQRLRQKPGEQRLLPRVKRNVFLPSGVRLCSTETVQQAMSDHLEYYQLRVCQEVVWEAFKIFLERLPNQEEYENWMKQCQTNQVSILEIGIVFSESEEHLKLVQKRVAQTHLQSKTPTYSVCRPENIPRENGAVSSGREVSAVTTALVPSMTPDVVVTETVKEVTTEVIETTEMDTEINNEIEEAAALPSLPLAEQRVELALLLAEESWSEELLDPTSIEYKSLTQEITEKISAALGKLTEFKSVSVLNIRPQMDPLSGDDAVLVEYVISLQTSGDKISSETMDFINLQSNMVEGSFSYSEVPTVQYTIVDLHPDITEALHVVKSAEKMHPGEMLPDSDHKLDILQMEDLSELPGVVLRDRVSTGDFLDPTPSENDAITMQGVALLEESITPLVGLPIESFSQDSEHAAVPFPPTQSSYVEVETVGPITDYGGITMDEMDPSSGSGSGDEDLETEVLHETHGLDGESQDVWGEEDTKQIDDYEFSTITTVVKEDQITPEETTEVVTINLNIFSSNSDIPSVQPVENAGTETTQEAEDPTVLPGEENQEKDSSKETSKNEETHISVITEEIEKDEGEYVDSTTMMWENNDFLQTDLSVILFSEDTDDELKEDEVLLVTVDPVTITTLFPLKESPISLIPMMTPEEVDLGHSLYPEVITTSMDIKIFREEEGSGMQGGIQVHEVSSIALPTNPGRSLMVFFSLRVTNMIFSEDLFNKSSAEYKALEQQFLELLVPYLQSNLSNFENLEILNFRNGSIVVNSRMKFGKPVPRTVNTAVYLILEDFCNTAYQTMNLAIDKYSLDVESGEQADPCKFQACNEFAKCTVNQWSGEAECVCNAGYFSVDGLPCQSICDLQQDFCLNDGKCDIIPGKGAICRCRVGENWWYRGEHCEEYVSEPLVVGIAIASVAGFLLVASGVIFFLARTLRDQYDKDETEDPIRREDTPPFIDQATKYNPMFESDLTTGYSHYYQRYPEPPVHSSASAEASTDFGSEEIRHIYENSELTKEEIQDRIRILELYAQDRQFADFVRHHQVSIDSQKESSSS